MAGEKLKKATAFQDDAAEKAKKAKKKPDPPPDVPPIPELGPPDVTARRNRQA